MTPLRALIIASTLISFAFAASAADYVIDHTKSRIAFSGTHADTPFHGHFDKWDAKITFDPDHLESSHITVTIDTPSITTGNALYDGTLPSADWFNVEDFPTARYESMLIKKLANGDYETSGMLTIKNIAKSIYFTFTLSQDQKEPSLVSASFSLPIDRLAFAIGKESDPEAEWVSKEITLKVTLSASATPNSR